VKAALYDRYGPAREVLRVEDVERPEPGPGEVRVRVEFSEALIQAAGDITGALADGTLTELPVIRYPLDQIAAAQDAVEAGAVGKVLVVIPG
jgi:NADPH:quinone reductase-like Zn-dependent oxidoreductase